MRPHIAAIYAFARLADDMADEGDRPAAARLADLDAWDARLDAALREFTDARLDLLRTELQCMNVIPSLPATEVARTRWSPN